MKSSIIAVIPLFLGACAPASPKDPNESMTDASVLAPPPQGRGMQLRMMKSIAPGLESYGCQLFQMPDEDVFIHEQTVQFSAGGHHVLLYVTPYAMIPERDENGELVDAAKVHDCSEGVTARWKVTSVLGGSEIFDHPGMFRGLPEGVAVRLPKKTVVVMSVHYLNASSHEVDVDARVNLSAITREEMTMEAGLLYLDNRFLHVPPRGKASSRMRCPIPENVFVANLQSHLHARGVFFSATARDEKLHQSTVVYETKKWLEPPVTTYEPYLELRAGQFLETRCDYENNEARAIGYGPKSTDEMCQLIGPYFPRNADFESCADASGNDAALWIGQGSADGAATLDCFDCTGSVENLDYVACMYDACPSIAERASAFVRCRLSKDLGSCQGEKLALSKAVCHD